MKIKNLSINKRIASVVVAVGFSLCAKASADIISYNQSGAKLSNGMDATLYFTTGTGDNDMAYISFGEGGVGYVYNKDIQYYDFCSNNDYMEVSGDMLVNKNDAYLYQEPIFDNQKIVGSLDKNSIVHVLAKNQDGWYAVINDKYQTGFIYESYLERIDERKDNLIETIRMAKITGNNVNVRSGPSTKDSIIGFCDVTDCFKVIDYSNDWYMIDYLGKTGYVSKKYVKEINVDSKELKIKKQVYLKRDSSFYNLDGTYMITLPKYQNAFVLEEVGDYYKVKVDGIVGYIEKNNTKNLSSRCVVIDLSRQILRVFENNNEIMRAHIITGGETMQTNIGCFKIGHRVPNYQLTPTAFVKYWMQFDGNIGIHDASWQSDKNYADVASNAYSNFSKGKGKTYPSSHGSHGCNNMKEMDASFVYHTIKVGDNVLVIGPNDLIKNNIISKNNELMIMKAFIENNDYSKEKVKKLTYSL